MAETYHTRFGATLSAMPRRLPLLLLVLTLAGCAAGPERPVESTAPSPAPAVGQREVRDAYRALEQGDYLDAAARFDRLAAEAKPPLRQEYLLNTAEALVGAELLNQAAQVLGRIEPDGMGPQGHTRSQLIEARIALKLRDGEQALALLATPRDPSVEPSLMARFHLLRAQAYAQLGNFLEAAREYALREHYLTSDEEIVENQRELWAALATLSEPVLAMLRTEPPPDPFSGWLELARLAKSRLTGETLDQQLARWQQDYPNHPVRPQLLDDLRQRSRELTSQPLRIGLLLPLSGRFADPAKAVRDGVLAAYFDDPNRRAVIRTYDSGPTPTHVEGAYDQAAKDGAEFILGPLLKEEVEVLSRREALPVPVLALNYTNAQGPAGLYEFGLPPEDEASQVAERLWVDGHSRVAMVIPEGAWGQRIGQAFIERWQQLGGQLVAQAVYNTQDNDFSVPLRNMLALDDSFRRHRQAQALLGEKLEFQPRRRQDIDAIFMAAFPRQARLLRPQLKFHHAADLPVYSTSHVFTGDRAPDLDRDMDGVVFGDMPWVLENMQPTALNRYDGQLKRLVALGVDAYNVLPYLRLLEHYPTERYDGGTGSLRVDGQNRVRRQMIWARFAGGKPRRVELDALFPEVE